MGHGVFAIVLLSTSVVTVFGQQYIRLPTSYVNQQLVRPEAKSIQVWNASVCASVSKTYHGYVVMVDINLPENLKWNPLLGVVYATVSNGTSITPTTPVFCQNYEADTAKSSCNYLYDEAMGPNIIVTVRAGDSSHIQYSLGVSFVNKTTQLASAKKTILSPEETKKMYEILALPVKSAVAVVNLVPMIRLDTPGVVDTLGVALYTFNVCPSQAIGSTFTIEIVVVGAQPDDAFSTYACKALPCTADNNNVIIADISDSSINVVQVSYNQIAPTGDVFLTIFGFGGKETNQFSLGAVVRSK
ncbi:uncharacterized protein LOC134197881 [Corticium candelabrum]|uniref:uncharacterized protein LOC134197881 n=1 Tax=Corticium candelabrum TaxID=121492 RepID=UPI002E25E6C3|nr:uncharacterized protein LOC134197881 [Corticium candelabrum]